MRNIPHTSRKSERGITILLVAAAMVAVVAMAALAVDIVALYIAKAEAQRAADASALAAAKMFVSSGYTSNSAAITQSDLCRSGGAGGAGAANKAAEGLLAQNQIVGQAATLQTITCDFTQPTNPLVTITVQRAGLPTLFGRIWGAGTGTVNATAKAEAFNPSGGSTNIAVGSVKPWLIANDCPTSCTGPFFVNASYGIANTTLIGQSKQFDLMIPRNGDTAHGPPDYYFYPLDPPQPNSCPSNSAISCSNIGTGPPGIFYHDNIACSNTAFQYSCGQTISSSDPVHIDVRPQGPLQNRTTEGISCLIHSSAGAGQDTINATTPVTIDGGSNNPNVALQNVTNISRSDSVVTVPVYNGADLGCSHSGCTNTATIIGFLQLGINDVTGSGNFHAVIMNIAPCNPANNSGTPVVGGGVSPVPVRLVSQ